MAEIRPFQGLRFSAEAGLLDTLVAPPYDVLSPQQREEYAARNAHNVVHLTLPESREDDRSKYVKYARSAALLSEWRREGALAPESKPAIYRYTQTFGEHVRTAIIALIKVEPYSKGVVLPHEQTFPKHKEDRLRILEATRSHLECIFGLYEDPAGEVLDTIKKADVTEKMVCKSDDGVEHWLEPIVDEQQLATLTKLMDDKKVWIADGHHRYETALNFREQQGEKEGRIAEDYMMMALTSMSDPGLILLPTHRMLSKSPVANHDELTAKLSTEFNLEPAPNNSLIEKMEALHAKGQRSFGVTLPGGQGLLLTPKDDQALVASIQDDSSEALRGLDVTILHRVILEKLLGVNGLDTISYTRDPEEAVQAVENGSSMAFLMIPPSVDDMKVVALGGEKMPQKSTYYFPKILSGIVLWSLNDF